MNSLNPQVIWNLPCISYNIELKVKITMQKNFTKFLFLKLKSVGLWIFNTNKELCPQLKCSNLNLKTSTIFNFKERIVRKMIMKNDHENLLKNMWKFFFWFFWTMFGFFAKMPGKKQKITHILWLIYYII